MSTESNNVELDSGVPAHKRLLAKFCVGDLVSVHQSVVVGHQDTTVETALAIMKKNKVTSLPVLDAEQKEYMGMVNLFDLATAVAFNSLFKNMDEHAIESLSEEHGTNLHEDQVFQTPLVHFLGLSEESKSLWVYNSSDSLRDLLDVFSKGVHRVLVRFPGRSTIDPQATQGHYDRVLSQSDVVRFLHTNAALAAFLPVMESSLEELHLASTKSSDNNTVVSVDGKIRAITAFQKLILHEVSAIAICDEEGALISTLSVSDFRGISHDTFKYLLLPVLDFLKVTRGVHVEPVSCHAQDTLRSVLNKVMAGSVHRCWVVDEAGRPTGLVSLTDIIMKFSPYDLHA